MNVKEMIEKKKEAGYSCEQIAKLSGVPIGTVQKIFSGITKRPRHGTVLALERILKNTGYGAYKEDDSLMVSEAQVSYSSSRDPVKPWEWPDQGSYTVDDYLDLPEDVRAELINGVFYDMGAPSAAHQIISAEITYALMDYIKKKNGKCQVFTAPFAIQLDRDDKTMVQPDVLVICKRSGYTKERGIGAPDLCIEILSPSTRKKDMNLKNQKYTDAGVREYWIVEPDERKVLVYDIANGAFPAIYGFNTKIPVAIWDNECEVDLSGLEEKLDEMQ